MSRITLRIRYQEHAEYPHYDVHGLRYAIQMRLMLQLLEHRLRSRKTCVGLGLRTPFDTVVAKRLKRVLRYLFTYTLSATTYKNILWYLLARCCGVQPRHPFVSSHELQPTPAEPGPHFATRHEKYPLADRVLELIPESILRGYGLQAYMLGLPPCLDANASMLIVFDGSVLHGRLSEERLARPHASVPCSESLIHS